MKARPILFSGAMVRALLDGRKTQTRRVVKAPAPEGAVDAGVISSGTDSNGIWWWLDSTELEWASPIGDEFRCPYGVPGDLLWARESGLEHRQTRLFAHDATPGRWWTAEDGGRYGAGYGAAISRQTLLRTHRVRPSIHMPRWASRLTLEIEDIRIERLQAISEADALAEGIVEVRERSKDGMRHFGLPGFAIDEPTAARGYAKLWATIHGPDSWAANPWVWAVTAPPVHQNVDAFTKAREAI